MEGRTREVGSNNSHKCNATTEGNRTIRTEQVPQVLSIFPSQIAHEDRNILILCMENKSFHEEEK